MTRKSIHQPVLLNEVIEILNPRPGEFFIDGTVDGGGHGFAILEKIEPNGLFMGLDWDSELLEQFKFKIQKSKFKSKIILINANFKNIPMILKNNKLNMADGIFLDLGFSSEHIERSGRGFSFSADEPLLMTYNSEQKPAWRWLEELNERNLAEIIRGFGGERYAKQIAKAIKKNLPIKTSGRLAAVIKNTLPASYERGRINPATRTFQALRVFVNQEIENLKDFLRDFINILKPGGRLGIISFHSLEDRLVKVSFRQLAEEKKVAILTKKPVRPAAEEKVANPRSRSARFRAVKKI